MLDEQIKHELQKLRLLQFEEGLKLKLLDGKVLLVFDGLDDNGKPLKPGKYKLFIEVAREHGTYQIIRQPLELGANPIETTQLKSNVEIKSASFEYRKPAEKKPAN